MTDKDVLLHWTALLIFSGGHKELMKLTRKYWDAGIVQNCAASHFSSWNYIKGNNASNGKTKKQETAAASRQLPAN